MLRGPVRDLNKAYVCEEGLDQTGGRTGTNATLSTWTFQSRCCSTENSGVAFYGRHEDSVRVVLLRAPDRITIRSLPSFYRVEPTDGVGKGKGHAPPYLYK